MAMLTRRRSQIPGSRFTPTDLELINYLRRRIERNKRSTYITDMNVYEKEPWLLQHVTNPKFEKNVWFYFVTRKKPPRIKKPDSTRTSRVVGSCRWKTTGLLTHLIDEENRVKVGTKQSIIFKIKGKKDEINTGWVMHEFILNKPGFQEMVLCKFRFKQDKNNAQYAPRLEPIVIEEGSLVKRKEQKEEDFKNLVSSIDFKGSGQGMDLPQLPMEFQEPWFGSSSGQAVSYTSYLMNGGIEQHQGFGSCCQQQNQILGNISLTEPHQHHGQGFGDMTHEYLNQYLGQETVPMMNQAMIGYYAPYLAQPYLGQDMAQMTQGMMVPQQEQYFPAQYQQFSKNGGMEEHQNLGSCGQFVGESLGQQQNQFLGKQGMMDHQDFGFSSLCLAQNNQYLGHNNDLSMIPMETQQGIELQQHDNSYFDHNVVGDLATQQQHLGQGSNFSLTQQQNIDPPTLPVETQQQDNIVENFLTQLQLEKNQETILPINQGIDESRGGDCDSSTLNELIQKPLDDEFVFTNQELDIMRDNFGNEEWAHELGKNTPEEEAELMASLGNCNTLQSLLNSFCPM